MGCLALSEGLLTQLLKGDHLAVEKLERMTPEEANRRLSLTPPAGCRNSFSSCNDGKATSDDLHRKDWDGLSPQADLAAAPPHLGSLHKSDIIVRFARINGELAPHLKVVPSVETKNLLSTTCQRPLRKQNLQDDESILHLFARTGQ